MMGNFVRKGRGEMGGAYGVETTQVINT